METTDQVTGYPHQNSGRRCETTGATRVAFAGEAVPRIDWDALRSAGQSCCCPARPAVIVLMPPAHGRPHRTDLLLCMHHFRGARRALVAAGAWMLDMRGGAIDSAAPAYLMPR
jgi:hypothetical protein